VRYPFFFIGREVLVTGITKMTSYGFPVRGIDLSYLILAQQDALVPVKVT